VQKYGVREVQKLLRLPRSTLRALISAGFVSPERGPRNTLRFSFQDLIALRTAQALAAANVPSRRITRAIKALRRRLPEAMPLSGLSISAVADRVIVREGVSRWQAESGQYLLGFEGDPAAGSLSVVERIRAKGAEPWFERAEALEESDGIAAVDAYRRAIAADPSHVEARINLGRLLHNTGRLPQAESVYREAIAACGPDPVLLFNFGVLLDDMKRKDEAAGAYEEALRADPAFADCCYNLALLCEELGRRREAIRHMARYRRLRRGQ
jgi:tetratricopeptide (TPR) repeat protein